MPLSVSREQELRLASCDDGGLLGGRFAEVAPPVEAGVKYFNPTLNSLLDAPP
jgi:hypothetical protein